MFRLNVVSKCSSKAAGHEALGRADVEWVMYFLSTSWFACMKVLK